MVQTKIWEQTLLPVREKHQSDSMLLKKILLLIDPTRSNQQKNPKQNWVDMSPVLLSAGGSMMTWITFFARSDCASFFWLFSPPWTLHYWGTRPRPAPVTNKLCVSEREFVVYLVYVFLPAPNGQLHVKHVLHSCIVFLNDISRFHLHPF